MPFMTWTDKLSVGVKVFDDDHKKLIGTLNQLNDGMKAGHGKEVLEKVLAELVDYTKFHFAREEETFAKTGYPEAATQKKQHAELVKRVLEMQARFKKGELTLSLEVMDFLKDWLINHIQGTDKKYGPFLNAKGIL